MQGVRRLWDLGHPTQDGVGKPRAEPAPPSAGERQETGRTGQTAEDYHLYSLRQPRPRRPCLANDSNALSLMVFEAVLD
jgi:hypothetical protein